MFTQISRGLIRGKSAFLTINPSPINVLRFGWVKYFHLTSKIIEGAINVYKKKTSAEDFAANIIGSSIVGSAINNRLYLNKLSSLTSRGYLVAKERSNWKLQGLGASRRTWITNIDKSLVNDRIVKPLTIIYHDAHKAGKHIDLHMGHLSLIYRVSGKPVERKIQYNNKGLLTEESKKALIAHIQKEIAKNARVPQNHDHTISNARCSWKFDPDDSSTGYGSGKTRQIVIQDKVEFYHPEVKSSLHIYAPVLNKHQGLYLYQIYPGKNNSAPILIFGNLIPLDDNYKDRLHLKLIPSLDEFKSKVDVKTTTIKEDGASCYFSSNGQGFKFFSPRFSIVTGHRVEYTYKIAELADKGHPLSPQGMGELLFYKKFLWIKHYLSAAEIGGILNSYQVRPSYIYPDIKVYRMDKWNNKSVIDLPFFKNRKLQNKMVSNLKGFWSVVRLAKPKKNNYIEGYVATIKDSSILDGSKVKFKDNEFDWKIDSINLSITDKNRIAGVINCTSLESGKQYNLGPGSIGTQEECIQMINKPLNYVGKVIKVSGYRQHEGRAAKIVAYHLDKGI
jgi:hypothetical protein